MASLLKVRLTLRGRPIRTYTFNKQRVSIGRDPAADIFLDNPGISREHAKIDRTAAGYVLEDLGSANGTFLNDLAVAREVLGDDDVVRIGKFTLWVGLESDRRDKLLGQGTVGPDALGGTMILSAEQMVDLTRKSKIEEAETKRREFAGSDSLWSLTRSSFIMAMVSALLLGVLVGAALALRFVQ